MLHHAITIGGLLGAVGLIGGLCIVAIGALIYFAASMSDAPDAADSGVSLGCFVVIGGAALFVLSLVGLVL